MSNSVNPDEKTHYEPSPLNICCLQKPVIIACDSERVKKSLLNPFCSKLESSENGDMQEYAISGKLSNFSSLWALFKSEFEKHVLLETCAQRRFKSVSAFAQSDQNLLLAHI